MLRDLFAGLGHEAGFVPDGAPGAGPGEVILLIGNANYFPATFRRLRALPPAERPATLLWHVEPLPAPAVSGLRPARRHLREWAKIALRDARMTDPRSNWARLERVHRDGLPTVVVVSTRGRQAFLAEHGIDAPFVPFGHYASLGRDMGLERDIDVMFLASQDVPRRARIVRRMRRAGIDVVSAGAWGDDGLWGAERTRVLNRTKIVLNLGRHPGELSGLRLLKGMATRACVLSEPIWDPAPYVPGLHYAEAPVEELAEAAAALLADDARRTAIADAGHAFALAELTMDMSIAALSELATKAARPQRPGSGSTPPTELPPR
jgi:hypothetical protein